MKTKVRLTDSCVEWAQNYDMDNDCEINVCYLEFHILTLMPQYGLSIKDFEYDYAKGEAFLLFNSPEDAVQFKLLYL